MIQEDPNLTRTWTRSTLCVLCVCAFVRPAAAWKTRRSSSKYIGQRIFCFGRADLAWVVNLILNLYLNLCVSRRGGGWLRGHCFTKLAQESGLQGSITLSGTGMLPRVACKRRIHHPRTWAAVMMNASCSFGGIPGLGSWVLGLGRSVCILQKASHTCGATEALILLSSTKPPQPLP
jgi:hypothetical protein